MNIRYALLGSLQCRLSEISYLGACEAYGVAIASGIVAIAVDGSAGGSNVELVGDGAGAGEGHEPEEEHGSDLHFQECEEEMIQGLVYWIVVMELVVTSKGKCVLVRVLIDLVVDDSFCRFREPRPIMIMVNDNIEVVSEWLSG